MSSLAGIDLLLSRLEHVRHVGPGQWMASCPAHADKNPSLSVKLKNAQTVLFHCHANCSPEAILAALGLTWKEILPPREETPERVVVETYPYRDETGALLFEVVRYCPKDFRQRRPDGSGGWLWNLNGARRVLYRLPELHDADPEATALVVEGEKDVDRLRSLGYVATCNPGGAGKWQAEYSEALRGRSVIVISDADGPGRAHAGGVAQALDGIAASVAVLELPDAKDASAFLDHGGTTEQLDHLLEGAPELNGNNPAAAADIGVEQVAAPQGRLIVSAEQFLAERDEAIASLWGAGLYVAGGGYLIMSGEGGVGKTILLLGLHFHLAAGSKEFLGIPLPGAPQPVLVLEAEGSRQRFRPRANSIAESYGFSLAKLPVFFHARETTLSIEQLGDMMKPSGARAALLDPIGRFHEGEENSSKEWRKGVTNPLGKLAREFSAGISFSDHYSKPNEMRSNRHKLRGSAAKVDDCGAALRLEYGKGGKSSRVLFFDRVRDGALPDPDRIALSIDVASGFVRLDPETIPEAVPDNPVDERAERQRLRKSELAQREVESALLTLERRKDWNPEQGASERRLAEESGLARAKRPFKDALRGLEAQKVFEVAPGGGWRRASP